MCTAPAPTVTITRARFYLFVNQIANFVPFAVSSGVADVGVRRGRRRVGVHRDGRHSRHRRTRCCSPSIARRTPPPGRERARELLRRRRRHYRRRRRASVRDWPAMPSRLGMTVVLADIDADAIAALRDELCAAGASAVDVVCDVRDADAVQAARRTRPTAMSARCGCWSTTPESNSSAICGTHRWPTGSASSTSTSAESSTACGRFCRR